MKSLSKMTKAFTAAILMGYLVLFGLTPAVPAQEVEGVFLGNMGFQFTTITGKVILTDPLLGGGPGFTVDELPGEGNVDLILVSGAHSDNLGNTIPIAIDTGATVIATAELSTWIISQGVPTSQVFSMMQGGRCGKPHGPEEPDDPCDLLGISVKVVQAIHTAGIATGQAPQGYGGTSIGFVITFENDLRVYFSGDTGLFGDMKLIGELYKPHVAILSAAGRFMMEPEDAALATKSLRTQNPNLKTIIPAHFIPPAFFPVFPGFTGSPEKVAEEVEKLGLPVTVLDLEPGDTFTLVKPPGGPEPQ